MNQRAPGIEVLRWRWRWAIVCALLSIPAVSLPVMATLFNGHTPMGERVLGIGQGAAMLTSGPGGLVALAWEENFPISQDREYICIMGVLSMVYWGAVCYVGWAKGRPLLVLLFALVLSFGCGLLHLCTLVDAHT